MAVATQARVIHRRSRRDSPGRPQLAEHRVDHTVGRERADRGRRLVHHHLLVLGPADLRTPFGPSAKASWAGPRPSIPPVVVSLGRRGPVPMLHGGDEATVHPEVTAGDEGRLLGAQELHRRSDVGHAARQGRSGSCRVDRIGVSRAMPSLTGCSASSSLPIGVSINPGDSEIDPAASRRPDHRGALARPDHPPFGQTEVARSGSSENRARNRSGKSGRRDRSSTASIVRVEGAHQPGDGGQAHCGAPGNDPLGQRTEEPLGAGEVGPEDVAPPGHGGDTRQCGRASGVRPGQPPWPPARWRARDHRCHRRRS